MAGGGELEQLSHELERAGGAAAEAAHVLEEEVGELGISRPAEGGSWRLSGRAEGGAPQPPGEQGRGKDSLQ
jgi:hypothetical protein